MDLAQPEIFARLKDPKFGTPPKVLELRRFQSGGLKLDVDSGKWRFLSKAEEQKLLQ